MAEENIPSPDDVVLNPGTPEYDAAMVAKFDESQAASNPSADPAVTTAERPANVPEKFWDAEKGQVNTEALLASYTALEGKLGGKAPDTTADASGAAADEAKDVVEKAGLNFEELSDRFLQNGSLSEEDYAALEKGGIPRSMVDSYIAGQQARVEVARAEAFSIVGGEQTYVDMVQWAAKNMSKAEVAAYNAAVDSGDVAARDLAITGLHSKYTAAVGSEPSLLGGTTSTSGDVYRSTAEMTRDMRDPRYSSDPAFRAAVAAKLANSSIF